MIAAYGKLPISKEYLRHNCHDGMALRFRDWMDGGYDYAGSRSLVGRKEAAYRVYFSSPEARSAVQAIVSPSKDASGSREFPFALLLPEAEIPSEGPFFGSLEGGWAQLEEEFERLKQEADTDAFFATVRGLTLEPQPVSCVDDREAKAADWIEGLFRYDPIDMFVRALWRLRGVSPHLDSATPELRRVRVPINRSSPLGPQIDLWRSILARLHPTYSGSVSLFAPSPSERAKPTPAGAWLVFEEPRPSDFGAAIGGRLEDGNGVDLVDNEGRMAVDGFGAFRERLEAAPLSPAGTIDQLLSFDILA